MGRTPCWNRERMRSPASEEKGAAETMYDRMILVPIPYPVLISTLEPFIVFSLLCAVEEMSSFGGHLAFGQGQLTKFVQPRGL